MSKHEIENVLEINKNIINTNKAVVKKLTFIRDTLAQIAPAISLDEIDDEIATLTAEIEEAKTRLAKRKKQLKLLEQIEALNN